MHLQFEFYEYISYSLGSYIIAHIFLNFSNELRKLSEFYLCFEIHLRFLYY